VSTPSFNLIDEPWILIQDHHGATREVSIHELLATAPDLRSIGGDIPTQSFAIIRLLIAVLRRAIRWESDPARTWSAIWAQGRLPQAELDEYLRSVRPRFDLFDPAEPFYQVADLHTASGEFKPIELLMTDVPTGWKYFTTRAGRGTASIAPGEAARWLVHCQGFDASGIKSADPRDPRGKNGKGYPIGVAWAGQLGGVIFEGRTLFQTLMLNTVAVDRNGRSPDPADLPAWEHAHADFRQRTPLVPAGPADLLTWQSRRIRLVAERGAITRVLVANGDPLEAHNRYDLEYMTGWRFSEVQSKKFGEDRYLPKRWSPDEALWRGMAGLLADVSDGDRIRNRASETAHWLERLVDARVVDPDLPLRPHAFGLDYINQASVVGASVDDSLQLRVALLGRASTARLRAERAVDAATEAVRALKTLARRLTQAAGGAGEAGAQEAGAAAYFALDDRYRKWLAKLTEDSGPAVVADWEKEVSDETGSAARQLVSDAGEHAWRGRLVDGRRLDSAVALTLFRGALRKALPAAFEDDRTDGGTA